MAYLSTTHQLNTVKQCDLFTWVVWIMTNIHIHISSSSVQQRAMHYKFVALYRQIGSYMQVFEQEVSNLRFALGTSNYLQLRGCNDVENLINS